MKKLAIVGLVLGSIILLSCGGDDEDSLIGTWSLAEVRADCDNGESVRLTANNGCYTDDDISVCFYLNFTEGGTGVVRISVDGDEDTSNFTYTENGNQVTICDSSDDCEVAIVNGNQLTLPSSDDCDERLVFRKD